MEAGTKWDDILKYIFLGENFYYFDSNFVEFHS